MRSIDVCKTVQKILKDFVPYSKGVPIEELAESFQIIDEKERKVDPTLWGIMIGFDYKKLTIVSCEKSVSQVKFKYFINIF